MGILEKLGLVESTDSVKEESNGDVQAQFYAYASSQSELSVNIEPVPDTMLLDGVIDIPEIYEKFELSNTDNSIYKIDEISSVLPKEMPLEKKVYFVSQEEAFDRVKNAIQISIDNMRNK